MELWEFRETLLRKEKWRRHIAETWDSKRKVYKFVVLRKKNDGYRVSRFHCPYSGRQHFVHKGTTGTKFGVEFVALQVTRNDPKFYANNAHWPVCPLNVIPFGAGVLEDLIVQIPRLVLTILALTLVVFATYSLRMLKESSNWNAHRQISRMKTSRIEGGQPFLRSCISAAQRELKMLSNVSGLLGTGCDNWL